MTAIIVYNRLKSHAAGKLHVMAAICLLTDPPTHVISSGEL